eukprot:2666027-Prymnesium_polylepis.1
MLNFAYPRRKVRRDSPRRPTSEQESEIVAIFRLYDRDRNGAIDRRELLAALSNSGLSSSEVKQLHREFDTDNSGAIEFLEFRSIMLSSGAYGNGFPQAAPPSPAIVPNTVEAPINIPETASS